MAEVRNYFTLDNATILILLQAIGWATTEWKVNIITMSSAFEKDDDEMESAIQEAYIKKILIFAAASNFGNSRYIASQLVYGKSYAFFKLTEMFYRRLASI